MRVKPQFRLRTLFVLTTLMALAVHASNHLTFWCGYGPKMYINEINDLGRSAWLHIRWDDSPLVDWDWDGNH